MMRILCISLIVICFYSCQKNDGKDFSDTEFFNVFEYSKEFCLKHQTLPTLVQIVEADGKNQEVEKDSSSLEFVRNMCKKANIDNPTLYDKYLVIDTTIENRNITEYQSLDDNLLVKNLKISRNNSGIESVIMNTSYGNLMSQTDKVIEFYSNGEIHMETHTTSQLSEDIDMKVFWNLQ